MCTSTRAVIAVCVCARERDARVACHVSVRGAGPARESFKASSDVFPAIFSDVFQMFFPAIHSGCARPAGARST